MRNYIKFNNSQNTTDEMWSKLSNRQQKKLIKLINRLNIDLDKFRENDDVAYSFLMHVLSGKIVLEEKEVVKKELCAVQVKPFEKFDKIDNLMSGEVKW